VVRKAFETLGSRGTLGIVGASPEGAKLGLALSDVLGGARRIIGIIEGDSVPDLFIPRLIELWRQGRFPFDKLVRFYRLEQINGAAAARRRGATIKPVLRMEAARACGIRPSRRRK